jgi:hypothetical protein
VKKCIWVKVYPASNDDWGYSSIQENQEEEQQDQPNNDKDKKEGKTQPQSVFCV